MKFIITENQLNNAISEMAYPTQFNMEAFKNMRSFRQRIEYCEQNLKRISSGSGRIAYQIDNDKVLKLAKNAKGIAQNEVEADYSKDYYDIVAKVYDVDENYTFIEMELAKKINPSIFKNITGFDFKLVYEYLNYYFGKTRRFCPPNIEEIVESLNENEFIIDIMELVGNYDLSFGDFNKISSFGLVNRNGENKIVLIDYGLTDEVYNTHYRR